MDCALTTFRGRLFQSLMVLGKNEYNWKMSIIDGLSIIDCLFQTPRLFMLFQISLNYWGLYKLSKCFMLQYLIGRAEARINCYVGRRRTYNIPAVPSLGFWTVGIIAARVQDLDAILDWHKLASVACDIFLGNFVPPRLFRRVESFDWAGWFSSRNFVLRP